MSPCEKPCVFSTKGNSRRNRRTHSKTEPQKNATKATHTRNVEKCECNKNRSEQKIWQIRCCVSVGRSHPTWIGNLLHWVFRCKKMATWETSNVQIHVHTHATLMHFPNYSGKRKKNDTLHTLIFGRKHVNSPMHAIALGDGPARWLPAGARATVFQRCAEHQMVFEPRALMEFSMMPCRWRVSARAQSETGNWHKSNAKRSTWVELTYRKFRWVCSQWYRCNARLRIID